MSPKKKARLAFSSALVLLLLSGIAASVTIVRLLRTAEWIAHTYEVQLSLADVQSAFSKAARCRTLYLASGDPSYLPQYDAAKNDTFDNVREARELTRDNPAEIEPGNRMKALIDGRFEILDESILLRKAGPLDESTQTSLDRENAERATALANVIEEMDEHEEQLLGERRHASFILFAVVLSILLGIFVLAILLLWLHFRLLSNELVERERNEANTRRLSGRLLQLQDEERRKFSRELHDSLGQLLAMAKMHLFTLLQRSPKDQTLAEIDKLLDQSVTETRTISYLLHPPLLDEMGLASAAKWYAEGFAERSGLEISLDIAEVSRLPMPAELALFRVVQESLTNIHRHSKSSRAEISLRAVAKNVVLRVGDNGVGIPPETLERFLTQGTQVGVGLAGSRERIREQGGTFDIQSDKNGTIITVTMPITAVPQEPEAPKLAAAASAD